MIPTCVILQTCCGIDIIPLYFLNDFQREATKGVNGSKSWDFEESTATSTSGPSLTFSRDFTEHAPPQPMNSY